MSKAFKCDECGKLFEDYERIPLSPILTEQKYERHKDLVNWFLLGLTLDFCPCCYKKRKKFIEGCFRNIEKYG